MANFVPELWSQAVVDAMKKSIDREFMRGRRDHATQLLRDAALGYPEYPEIKPPEGTETDVPDHLLDSFHYTRANIHRKRGR